MKIIYHLQEIRTEKQLTMRELADRSSVSRTEISDIENGKIDVKLTTLCLLAEALGVPSDKLYSTEK